MSSKKQLNNINGWIFVDKPKNKTSNEVLYILKKHFSPKKIGHGGTLDPQAQGVLPICFGEATKTLNYVLNADKTYEFDIHFGRSTTTDDIEGETINTNNFMPSKDDIYKVLPKFIGDIEQIPSKYSAIKINGERAYDLSRRGVDFDMKLRTVHVSSLELTNYSYENKTARFIARVSKGTYIRTLAKDIATQLSALGYVSYLNRLKIHIKKEIILISLNNMYNIEYYMLNKNIFFSIEDMLDDISAVHVSLKEAVELFNGNINNLHTDDMENGILKAVYQNKVIALLEKIDGNVSIVRIFNTYKDLIINNKEKTDVNY